MYLKSLINWLLAGWAVLQLQIVNKLNCDTVKLLYCSSTI